MPSTTTRFIAPYKASFVCALLLGACSSSPDPVPDAIQREVRAMAAEDQRWEQLVITRAPEVREPGFYDRKDELQDRHAERCRQIFEEHGLLSPGRVGDEVASDYWVLVQHADRDPAFQAEVLAAMDGLPEASVDPAERAYLVDRVRVNTDRPQVYGTQVAYDLATGRAFPKPLEEPAGVDERRAAVGLEPLWRYMNGMCELQFGMNRRMLEGMGVDAPFRYPDGWSDWSGAPAE